MLEIRTTLHLSFRLAVRANQALTRYGGAGSEGAGLWRAALPAFVVLDLVVWEVLRRDERFGLRWRLPLDALDAAFWAMSPKPLTGNYDSAVVIATPLAVEAGVRLGWRGLVVAAAVFAAAAAAGTLAGKPIGFVGTAWLVLAVAVGVGFLRYCRRLDDRADRERQRAVAAAKRRAYLAGQNEVAMGASSAVDAIEGLVPVLGRPRPGSPLWRLADGWKGDLRATTADEASYLQVVVLEWAKGHNRHPDLSGLVEIQVNEGHGTTLLSARQVEQLWRALDERHLHGQVAVRADHPEPLHVPGRPLRVAVNGDVVALPADRRHELPPFDPCFPAYLYVLMIELTTMAPHLGAAPVPVGVSGATTCVAAGVLSHRRAIALGDAARRDLLVLAAFTAVVLTLLSGFFRSPLSIEGDPLAGFGPGLLLLSFFGGFYGALLGRRQWAVLAAMAAVVALGIWVFPDRSAVTPRFLLAAVIYNTWSYLPLRHLARAFAQVGAQHLAVLQAVDEGAEQAAFLEGRDSVVGLVRQARADASGQLEAMRAGLDPPLADLATRRLEEVERRLGTMAPAGGSSSSTTTS